MTDEDGREVSAGDTIRFGYGIPPVCVEAEVIERNGKLIALTPGHTPKECSLELLKKYVGAFRLVLCDHVWMKAALDNSVWCIRCRKYGGEAN